ncbi:hypothetical protein, partial [uncultured Methylobacterium sp.]|uniref:hypothetical protein n=1 Tax=uncultured Methylobacterium sp. TaxID=157278 RepID=UPI0035CBDD7E
MAVGTADLTDAASRSSGRSTVRGARSADAGTAHAGFDRNLTAVTQAIDAARPPAGGVAPSGDAAAAALSEAGDAKRALTFAGRDAATTSGTPGALAKGTGGPTQVTARARSFTPAAMQASLTGTGRWLDLRSTPGGATKSEGTAASASADATKVDDASATKADREPVTKGLGEAAPTASTASVPAVAAPASQGPIAADAAPGPIRSGSLSPTRSVDTVRAKPGARFQSTDGSAETTGETTTRADGSAEATPDVGRIADPAETSDPKADPASATPDFDEGAPATSLANILGVAAPAPQGPVAAGAVPDLIPSESTVPMPSVDAARARPNARVQAVA